MSTHRKAARELQAAVKELGLEVVPGHNGCDVFRSGKRIAGYNMTNGTHSVAGAVRDLRKRGIIAQDEQVGVEKPRRTKPADARKARARKKVPAPITRLPRDVEGVPAERVRVENGVRFGVDGPTAPDPRTGVRTPVGQKFHRGTATGAAILAAASGLPTGVPVVADADDTVRPVKDDRADLAPQAVAPQSHGLGDTDRPAVPVRAVVHANSWMVRGVPVKKRVRKAADLPLPVRPAWAVVERQIRKGQLAWLTTSNEVLVTNSRVA